MAWSYNRLWKILIDKGLKRTQLIELTGINSVNIANMGKNKAVSMDVLGKICAYFDCRIEDIVEYIPDSSEEQTEQ